MVPVIGCIAWIGYRNYKADPNCTGGKMGDKGMIMVDAWGNPIEEKKDEKDPMKMPTPAAADPNM